MLGTLQPLPLQALPPSLPLPPSTLMPLLPLLLLPLLMLPLLMLPLLPLLLHFPPSDRLGALCRELTCPSGLGAITTPRDLPEFLTAHGFTCWPSSDSPPTTTCSRQPAPAFSSPASIQAVVRTARLNQLPVPSIRAPAPSSMRTQLMRPCRPYLPSSQMQCRERSRTPSMAQGTWGGSISACAACAQCSSATAACFPPPSPLVTSAARDGSAKSPWRKPTVAHWQEPSRIGPCPRYPIGRAGCVSDMPC